MKRDLRRRIMKLRLRAKITLLWAMFRDPAVPIHARAVLPLLAAYLAFPFDLIPDFIPILGQLDDLLVIAAGLGLFLMLTPAGVIELHLRRFE
jgi:uncharacterized membrane protein YkvA (DUF1232 family)